MNERNTYSLQLTNRGTLVRISLRAGIHKLDKLLGELVGIQSAHGISSGELYAHSTKRENIGLGTVLITRHNLGSNVTHGSSLSLAVRRDRTADAKIGNLHGVSILEQDILSLDILDNIK